MFKNTSANQRSFKKLASKKVNILKPCTHFFGLLPVFLTCVCFQGLIVTNFTRFILASFGTAHDNSKTTPTFCPSRHQTFCTKHWHSGVWRKPAARKGSVASCGGVEAWQFLGWTSNERALFFSVALNRLPSMWVGGVGLWGRHGGSVCVWGVPSCRHRVCQVQHYNSGGIVRPVCFFCPSEEKRSCSPFHLPLVFTQHATLFLHQTSRMSEWELSCRHSWTTGEDGCCRALNANPTGTHKPLHLNWHLVFTTL